MDWSTFSNDTDIQLLKPEISIFLEVEDDDEEDLGQGDRGVHNWHNWHNWQRSWSWFHDYDDDNPVDDRDDDEEEDLALGDIGDRKLQRS